MWQLIPQEEKVTQSGGEPVPRLRSKVKGRHLGKAGGLAEHPKTQQMGERCQEDPRAARTGQPSSPWLGQGLLMCTEGQVPHWELPLTIEGTGALLGLPYVEVTAQKTKDT